MRSVTTGLLIDHIKFQLKSYLDVHRVTDEIFIDRMNEAVSVHQNQKDNPSKRKTHAKVGLRSVQEQSAEVVKPKSCKTPAVSV